MKILVYGLNYAPELTGIGKFSGEMGAWLAGQGHDVRAVVAPPYYPEWRVHKGFRRWWYGKERIDGVLVYRCPLYVPRAPGTLTRLLHLVSFALSSTPIIFAQVVWRPDVMVTVVPTVLCTPAALAAGAICGATRVLHIQDFELDAMVGLGLGHGGRLARMAGFVERWLMSRFDAISSVSRTMLERAGVKTGHAHLFYVPNWVDTEFIRLRTPGSALREEWGIAPDTRVILYSGNVGAKQGLEIVLEVAASFADVRDVLFVFVGAGVAYEPLKAQARAKGLTNVQFHPLLPYGRMPDLLSLADVHLAVQRRGAADLVMPSKLAAILAAGGHVIITADMDTELGRLCVENPGVALRVDPENPAALAAGVRAALESPEVRFRQGNLAAREFAVSNLSKDSVLTTMLGHLDALRPARG